jgi:hypothetical protein
MLLLEFVSVHRQPVALILRLIKLPVHTLHLGAGLAQVPMGLLKLPAKCTKLQAETIGFGLPELQIVRDMRIERQKQICLGLRSRYIAIRSHRVRRFVHDLIRL